jgi:dGTPase
MMITLLRGSTLRPVPACSGVASDGLRNAARLVCHQGIFDSPFLDLKAIVPTPKRSLLDHFSREITFKVIIGRREVQTLEYKGEKIISELFKAFAEKPLLLVGSAALDPFDSGASQVLFRAEKGRTHWSEMSDSESKQVARAICDYIAGMTDPYAEKYHRRLFEPGFGSSTDEL